jgi:hypothetical protein
LSDSNNTRLTDSNEKLLQVLKHKLEEIKRKQQAHSTSEARDYAEGRAGALNESGRTTTEALGKPELWKRLMKQAIDEINPADLQEVVGDKPKGDSRGRLRLNNNSKSTPSAASKASKGSRDLP